MECSKLPGWDRVLFDPTVAAGTYATMAALLAGFALSGLIWIASGSKSERSTKALPAAGILSTIVPLITATLLFAELSGEQNCKNAFVLMPIASLLLAFGTVALLISLSQLLGSLFDDQTDRFAALVSATALLLGTLSTYVGNNTLNEAFSVTAWSWSADEMGQIAVLVVGLVLSVVLNVRRKPLQGSVPAFAYLVALGAFGVVAFYAISLSGAHDWLPEAVSWARTIGWTVFLVAASRFVRIPATGGITAELVERPAQDSVAPEAMDAQGGN